MPTPFIFFFNVHIFCLNGGAWTVVVLLLLYEGHLFFIQLMREIQLSVRQEMASNSKVWPCYRATFVVILKINCPYRGLLRLKKKRHLISEQVLKPPLVNEFIGLLKCSRCHFRSFKWSVSLCLLVLRLNISFFRIYAVIMFLRTGW